MALLLSVKDLVPILLALWTPISLRLLGLSVAAQSLHVQNKCLETILITYVDEFQSIDAGKTDDFTFLLSGAPHGEFTFSTGCRADGNGCTTGGIYFNGSTPITSLAYDYDNASFSTPTLLYHIDLSAGFNIGVQLSTGNTSCPQIACDNFKTDCPSAGPGVSCYGPCCDSFEACNADGGYQTCGQVNAAEPNATTEAYYQQRCPDATTHEGKSFNCTNADVVLTLCPNLTSDYTNGQALLMNASIMSTSMGTSTSNSAGASTTHTANPPNTEMVAKTSEMHHISSGEIAGAVIGAMLLLALLASGWLLHRKRARSIRIPSEEATICSEDVSTKEASCRLTGAITPFMINLKSDNRPLPIFSESEMSSSAPVQDHHHAGTGAGFAPQISSDAVSSNPAASIAVLAMSGRPQALHVPGRGGSLIPNLTVASPATLEASSSGSIQELITEECLVAENMDGAQGQGERSDTEGLRGQPDIQAFDSSGWKQEVDNLRQLVQAQQSRLNHIEQASTGREIEIHRESFAVSTTGSLARSEPPPMYGAD